MLSRFKSGKRSRNSGKSENGRKQDDIWKPKWLQSINALILTKRGGECYG
jgi:hypothetical protein